MSTCRSDVTFKVRWRSKGIAGSAQGIRTSRSRLTRTVDLPLISLCVVPGIEPAGRSILFFVNSRYNKLKSYISVSRFGCLMTYSSMDANATRSRPDCGLPASQIAFRVNPEVRQLRAETLLSREWKLYFHRDQTLCGTPRQPPILREARRLLQRIMTTVSRQ